MLPLRDTIRSRHLPIMTWLLIVANVLIFLFEISLSAQNTDRFINIFSLIPARLGAGQSLFFFSLISSMFLHAGWFHLFSNMLTLYIFGDNVEDRMGSIPYLLFYVLSGITAGLLQTFVDINSATPILGASGAIAGILGAYMLLYPRSRVVTLIFIFIFPWFVEIPAFIYLGFWFVSQLFSGVSSFGGAVDGVAWWAHIGGFAFGLFMVRFFLFRPPPPPKLNIYQVPDRESYSNPDW